MSGMAIMAYPYCLISLLSNTLKFARFVKNKRNSRSVSSRTFIYITKMSTISIEINKRARSSVPTIGTHDGVFHCDEVLACAMLQKLAEYKNAKILRSRDIKMLQENCDIIVDVGGIFDHDQKLYDHHQKTFQETMSSLNPEFGSDFNIRLSSAGLIYNYYGKEIIKCILQQYKNVQLSDENLNLVFKTIYKNFVVEIDAIDNGIPMFDNVEPLYQISTHLSERIKNLNKSWDEEDVDINKRFEMALSLAGEEFKNKVLNIGTSWINARDHVRKAIESAKNIYDTGEILFLEKFVPWKQHLSDLERDYGIEGIPKLVIYCDNTSSWRVAGVPITPDSFIGRKFLPCAWRGLRNEELSKIAGIPDLIFVHHTGFIGGAKTKEAAIEMAIKSLHWSMINSQA